jgi:predicted DNA-binding protein (MmcQ/YjbR family)
MAPRKPDPRSIEGILRTKALEYPETTEDFPWGHRALKVKGKAFIFMGGEGGVFSFSVKLKDSLADALEMGDVEPTHYGLGKHGWVTATVNPGRDAPTETFVKWVDESYRLVAPKKLVAQLDGNAVAPAAAKDKTKAKKR